MDAFVDAFVACKSACSRAANSWVVVPAGTEAAPAPVATSTSSIAPELPTTKNALSVSSATDFAVFNVVSAWKG